MANNNVINVSLSGQTGTNQFVGSSSPKIDTPVINQINDIEDETVLKFTSAGPGSVNYVNIVNNTTGTQPYIFSDGSDTDVGLVIQTKGTGTFVINSQNTTVPIAIGSGTALQHTTYLNFPNTAIQQTVTFPDATGTVTLLGNTATGTGDIVLQTSPTIITPQISQINDASGNSVLGLGSISSAVNTVVIANNSAGLAPLITTAGGDTDVDMQFNTQGSGKFTFYCNGLSSQFNVGSGAALEHLTQFTFPNTSAIQTVTWQDASGTVAYLSDLAALGTPSPLTKIDDTNVTLTLGGTPSTALLEPTSLTLGWTGQLAVSRGGTGVSSLGSGVQTALGQNVSGSGSIALTNSPILVTPTLGAASASSLSFSSTSGIIAANTNNNAAAGSVGEFSSQQVLTSSAISITSTVSSNVASLSLGAGNWIVYGNVGATSSITMASFNAWISLTSATMPDSSFITSLSGLNGSINGLATPVLQLSLATTTTVYLSVNCTFTGTGNAYGGIQAIRPR